jgi:hypothetical protein
MMSVRVLANHAHLLPESINPNGTAERLLRMLDACAIARAVAFAPFPHQAEKAGIGDANAWLAEQLKGHARLLGFGTIDPRRADVRDQVRRCAELGFVGLKLHPNAQGFDILSPRLFDVYAAAVEHKMFCTFHSGVHQARLVQTAVLRFDELAWEFPELRFSMEHVGGYHFFNEALAVIFNHVPPPWECGRCNVFAGLASVFTPDHNRFWYLSDERLRELHAQVGARQMIFGLDFPYNLEAETNVALETIRRLFNADDQALILGGNLARELGVD